VDLNLDTLKREILEYLESAGFAVFQGSPGGLEGLPMVLWDAERHPDYQEFLDVARKCGLAMVVFAAREFEGADLEEALEQLDACGLTRDEQRDYESRLRELRVFDGVTCSIELAFDYNSRLYVYQVQPDWYDEFLSLEEEIAARLVEDEELDDGDSLGGYFSKN
jgi:hypothetical protein